MIQAARYIVVAQTLFFLALTVVVALYSNEVSPTAAYAVIGLQFAGLCVIASWTNRGKRK